MVFFARVCARFARRDGRTNTKKVAYASAHATFSCISLSCYGATRLMSLGNIEHSLTLAMPRKQAVIRSRPMAKPP